MATTIREYLDSSLDSKIETKAGELWVCANGPGTLHVSSKPIYGSQDVSPYITLRGIEYHVSAHVIWIEKDEHAPLDSDAKGEIRAAKGWRVAPSTYQRGEETIRNWNYRQGVHASRRGMYFDKDTTDAARRALVQIVEEAVNAWSATPEAQEAIRQGSIRALHNDARSAEEKIAKKLAEVDELRAKVRAFDKQIAKLSK